MKYSISETPFDLMDARSILGLSIEHCKKHVATQNLKQSNQRKYRKNPRFACFNYFDFVEFAVRASAKIPKIFLLRKNDDFLSGVIDTLAIHLNYSEISPSQIDGKDLAKTFDSEFGGFDGWFHFSKDSENEFQTLCSITAESARTIDQAISQKISC